MTKFFPPRVQIDIQRNWGDCEDCGFFSSDSASVTIDGRECVQACYDGHLGGGNWDGDTQHVLGWALNALGYCVRLNGKPLQLPDYSINCYDSGFREQVPVRLYEGELTVIDIQGAFTPYSDEAPEGYLARATVSPIEGLAHTKERVFETDPEWGTVNLQEVMRYLLDQLCLLEFTESNPDED